MIPVKETEDGLEPISGNPVMVSLDGGTKAPLATILHESWTAEEREKFGVFLVEPMAIPEDMQPVGRAQFRKEGASVVQEYALKSIWQDQAEKHRIEVINASESSRREGCLALCGLAFPVIYRGAEIEIGCELHSVSEWEAFETSDLIRMGGKEAGQFWEENRAMILAIAGMRA